MKQFYLQVSVAWAATLAATFSFCQEGTRDFSVHPFNQQLSLHCKSSPVEIGVDVHGEREGVSFRWSSGEALPVITVRPEASQRYFLTVSNEARHFYQEYGFEVTVANPPVFLTTPDITVDKKICPGSIQVLTAHASGGVPPFTYTWANGMEGKSISIEIYETAELAVVATDACGSTSEATAKVHVEPHDPIVAPSVETVAFRCTEKNLLISPDMSKVSGGVGHGYAYSFSEWETEGQPVKVSPENGMLLTASVSDACRQQFKVVKIKLEKQPEEVPVLSNLQVCSGSKVNVLKNAGPGFGIMANGADHPEEFIETVEEDKSYRLYYIDACGEMHESERHVDARKVTADFSHQILSDGTVEILNTSKGEDLQYEWTIDGEAVTGTNPHLSLEHGAVHEISLKTTDDIGCSCTINRTIDLTENIEIPSSFTPDGDGLNDFFSIGSKGVFSAFHIEIFDRWGQLIYESSDSNFKWDGKLPGGNESPMNTYVFKINASLLSGKSYSTDGTITVFYKK